MNVRSAPEAVAAVLPPAGACDEGVLGDSLAAGDLNDSREDDGLDDSLAAGLEDPLATGGRGDSPDGDGFEDSLAEDGLAAGLESFDDGFESLDDGFVAAACKRTGDKKRQRASNSPGHRSRDPAWCPITCTSTMLNGVSVHTPTRSLFAPDIISAVPRCLNNGMHIRA